MDDKPIVAAATGDEHAEFDSGCAPVPYASPAPNGVWRRDIDALCRALDAQQRAHFPRSDAKDR